MTWRRSGLLCLETLCLYIGCGLCDRYVRVIVVMSLNMSRRERSPALTSSVLGGPGAKGLFFDPSAAIGKVFFDNVDVDTDMYPEKLQREAYPYALYSKDNLMCAFMIGDRVMHEVHVKRKPQMDWLGDLITAQGESAGVRVSRRSGTKVPFPELKAGDTLLRILEGEPPAAEELARQAAETRAGSKPAYIQEVAQKVLTNYNSCKVFEVFRDDLTDIYQQVKRRMNAVSGTCVVDTKERPGTPVSVLSDVDLGTKYRQQKHVTVGLDGSVDVQLTPRGLQMAKRCALELEKLESSLGNVSLHPESHEGTKLALTPAILVPGDDSFMTVKSDEGSSYGTVRDDEESLYRTVWSHEETSYMTVQSHEDTLRDDSILNRPYGFGLSDFETPREEPKSSRSDTSSLPGTPRAGGGKVLPASPKTPQAGGGEVPQTSLNHFKLFAEAQEDAQLFAAIDALDLSFAADDLNVVRVSSGDTDLEVSPVPAVFPVTPVPPQRVSLTDEESVLSFAQDLANTRYVFSTPEVSPFFAQAKVQVAKRFHEGTISMMKFVKKTSDEVLERIESASTDTSQASAAQSMLNSCVALNDLASSASLLTVSESVQKLFNLSQSTESFRQNSLAWNKQKRISAQYLRGTTKAPDRVLSLTKFFPRRPEGEFFLMNRDDWQQPLQVRGELAEQALALFRKADLKPWSDTKKFAWLDELPVESGRRLQEMTGLVSFLEGDKSADMLFQQALERRRLNKEAAKNPDDPVPEDDLDSVAYNSHERRHCKQILDRLDTTNVLTTALTPGKSKPTEPCVTSFAKVRDLDMDADQESMMQSFSTFLAADMESDDSATHIITTSCITAMRDLGMLCEWMAEWMHEFNQLMTINPETLDPDSQEPVEAKAQRTQNVMAVAAMADNQCRIMVLFQRLFVYMESESSAWSRLSAAQEELAIALGAAYSTMIMQNMEVLFTDLVLCGSYWYEKCKAGMEWHYYGISEFAQMMMSREETDLGWPTGDRRYEMLQTYAMGMHSCVGELANRTFEEVKLVKMQVMRHGWQAVVGWLGLMELENIETLKTVMQSHGRGDIFGEYLTLSRTEFDHCALYAWAELYNVSKLWLQVFSHLPAVVRDHTDKAVKTLSRLVEHSRVQESLRAANASAQNALLHALRASVDTN